MAAVVLHLKQSYHAPN